MHTRWAGRSPRIADLMIVVAATSIALPWTKTVVGAHLARDRELRGLLGRSMRWWTSISLWSSAIVPALTAASLAVLVIALRRPRPRLIRLSRRPGIVAPVAAILALAVELSLQGGAHALKWLDGSVWMRFSPPKMGFLPRMHSISHYAGFFVLGAWSPLILGARWTPSSTWTERAGRALGVTWVVLVILQKVMGYLGGL